MKLLLLILASGAACLTFVGAGAYWYWRPRTGDMVELPPRPEDQQR